MDTETQRSGGWALVGLFLHMYPEFLEDRGADDFSLWLCLRSSDTHLFDKVRGYDIKLLRYLSVKYICDLMVENKKVKFGMKYVREGHPLQSGSVARPCIIGPANRGAEVQGYCSASVAEAVSESQSWGRSDTTEARCLFYG